MSAHYLWYIRVRDCMVSFPFPPHHLSCTATLSAQSSCPLPEQRLLSPALSVALYILPRVRRRLVPKSIRERLVVLFWLEMRTVFLMTVHKAKAAATLVSRSLFPGNENIFSNDYSQGKPCHQSRKSFSFPWK